ncbi:hypothetical protein GGTG_10779 [Gaeumannomyces tritici R3-111a-1]|uniref:Uncharacterized protein n=1 Tax=Gaeumannomyces tritici (strain R3-111a-1) TaxID=644352 RepID=J3PBA6_GAET3|nr:hypothetical protein GGTG_10779 [Gaeumannomyces tritici R3-111a-1]EJT71522.1 hypothetical protein GGTG_10779 [Gaeumannomyces tritici R3-111a-1]
MSVLSEEAGYRIGSLAGSHFQAAGALGGDEGAPLGGWERTPCPRAEMDWSGLGMSPFGGSERHR